MVTNAGLNRIISFLDGDLTHLSLGTGVAPVNTDTTLPNEAIRKASTSFIDNFTLIKELFLDETEGNGVTYTNAGVFGNGATATIGTGELFAGGAINIVKDNTQSFTLSIEITVSEGD